MELLKLELRFEQTLLNDVPDTDDPAKHLIFNHR